MKLMLEVWKLVPFEPDGEVLSLTEAAKRLGLSLESVRGLVARSRLRSLVDIDEPNPTKRSKVMASDIELELARRRSRSGDSRIKHKRGRPAAP